MTNSPTKPAPTVEELLCSDPSLGAAARALSDAFDYPWDHMPAEGRRNMRDNAAKVLLAALAAAPSIPLADGDSPCFLEWGAVSLPVGDPSRVTETKVFPTMWEAIAEGALCGFDWRVYPLALTPPAV